MALLDSIRSADENYLIALANRGLYNRAQRELDTVTAFTAEGDALSVTFSDGVALQMSGTIQNYKCGCPSRSVCKHVLIAVLAAKNQAETEVPEQAVQQAPPDFSAVYSITAAQLEKLAGKRLMRQSVMKIQMGSKAGIEESATLVITLEDSGNTVRFLPDSALGTCSCTCKSAGFCAHKLEAVLHCIIRRNGNLPEEFLPPEDENNSPEFILDALPFIEESVQKVLLMGLVRLPQDCADRFEQLATICHSQRLANMERRCNRICGQLRLYAAKSAAFSQAFLFGDLCALQSLCKAVKSGDTSKEIIGVFREEYRIIPTLEMYGLGAHGWHSTGGYTGVTAHFYAPGFGQIITYTSALPDTANPDAIKLYNAAAPWNLPTKFSAVSHANLVIFNGKLSAKSQLSSSEAASAQVLGETDSAAAALESICYSDFLKLVEALWQLEQEENTRTMAAILQPARYGALYFDKIEQRLYLPVYDASERKLLLCVKYEPATKLLIQNLQWLEQNEALTGRIFARVSAKNGVLEAFPITLYGADTENLGLDQLKNTATNKGAYFDWGL